MFLDFGRVWVILYFFPVPFFYIKLIFLNFIFILYMNSKKINVLIPDCDSGHTMSVVRCLKEYPQIVLHGCAHDGKILFGFRDIPKVFL